MTNLLPTSMPLLVILGGFALLILALLALGKVPLRYNLRNLVVRWKTTAVTALAFTLVIGLLVFMLAFVNGMNRMMEASGHPENVMILSDGATDELFSNLPPSVDVMTLASDLQKQVERDGKGTLQVSKEVYVVVNQELERPTAMGAMHRFVQMRGIANPAIAAHVHEIDLRDGRWFSPTGELEVVLGEGVASLLGGDLGQGPLRPGAVLKIGPLEGCKVVGIMRSAGSMFNSEVWARDTVIQAQFGRESSYTVFVARAKNARAAQAATEALKNSAQVSGGSAVAAYTEPEYYDKLSETNKAFLIAIIFVAVIMAIGGVLGVMNTMFAAISQRAGDIGVLRLLGFTRWQILVSFLLESLVIALVGGLVGCALGSLANGLSATSIVSGGGGGGKSVVLRLTVDGNILALGLVFTLVMGALGGLIPSVSAMRLRPLESLR